MVAEGCRGGGFLQARSCGRLEMTIVLCVLFVLEGLAEAVLALTLGAGSGRL